MSHSRVTSCASPAYRSSPSCPTVSSSCRTKCAATRRRQDHACAVYIKFSIDGLNWGPLDAAGTLVTTTDGRELFRTPYVSWIPGGGANGTALISGQRVVSGPTGNKAVLAEWGSVLFQNTNLGVGPWSELEAPDGVPTPYWKSNGSKVSPGFTNRVAIRSS